MSFEDLTGFFSLLTISLGIKVFLSTLIFFYVVFAFVVWRQTQLMSEILNLLNFSPFLKLVAALHFFAAVIVLILMLVLFLF